jgi:hypothetical protein
MAEPTPSASDRPCRCCGGVSAIAAGLGDRLQFAAGDHLGQHHGVVCERLDLFLGIGAPCARFCTTSTPSVLPPRRIGTPRKE